MAKRPMDKRANYDGKGDLVVFTFSSKQIAVDPNSSIGSKQNVANEISIANRKIR